MSFEIRKNLLQRAQEHVGALMEKAGRGLGSVADTLEAQPNAGGLPGLAQSVAPTAIRWGASEPLQGAGGLLIDTANGLPAARATHGLTSLHVDPRLLDAAAALPLGTGAARGLLKGFEAGVAPSAAKSLLHGADAQAGILGGPRAKTAPLAAYEEFKKLDSRFLDGTRGKRDFLANKTGIVKLKDGSLVHEIDDSGMKLTDAFKEKGIAYDKPLSDVIEHGDFKEAYPELWKDIRVRVEIDPSRKRGGYYNPESKTIVMTAPNHESMLTGVAHELNHATGVVEGRASGGTPASAARAVAAIDRSNVKSGRKSDLLAALSSDDAYAYRSLQDEAYSRAVERRIGMTAAERHQRPIFRSLDLPEADQLVHRQDGGVMLADGSNAPESVRNLLNIGLDTNDGGKITPAAVRKAIKKLGINIHADEIGKSATEKTLIASTDRALTDAEAHDLAVTLKQDAIAQKTGDAGLLHGPGKEKWGEFNPDFFLEPKPPRRRSKGQTVDNPQRTAYPGIYGDPKEIARTAEAWVEPEDPILQKLFGVSRGDLAKIAERHGNMDASLPGVKTGGKGAESARNVMTGQNAGRLRNLLDAGREHAPKLTEGMTGWYVMDPLYQRFLKELGPEKALEAYKRFNTFTGMASPGSDVLTEVNRGTGADLLHQRGLFADFEKYAGVGAEGRGPGFPEHVRNILGHPYHSTAQAPAMRKFVDTGRVDMKSAKVPTYIEASGVPETGFQTGTLVGDAHFTRGVGLADVRTNADPHHSITNPEVGLLGPWWKNKVAEPSGYRAVPAQANLWGLLGPETGVDTALGAPKLELIAKQIEKTAKREGITPEEALSNLIHKRGQAGAINPKMLGLLGVAGAWGAATPIMSAAKKKAAKKAEAIRKAKEKQLQEQDL